MANYNSIHTGPQIDEAVSAALPDGRLDQAIQAAINTAVSRAVAQLAAKIHAEQHAAGGTDPITPAAIGALPLTGGDISGRLNVGARVGGAYFVQNEANYGTPNEFGQYLDLHMAGSTTDYDLRLFLDANHNLYCQKPGGKAELLLHTGNAAESGMGGGLTLLKTLTVEENDVEELEFQLTAEELNKYKRFVIFPKLESEWYSDNSGRDLYLEAPTFPYAPAVNLGRLKGLCSNGVAFISVGANYNTRGWSLRMMALNYSDPGVDYDSDTSDKGAQNPTTEPLTFRLYTEDYPFIKGGTVSIMGVN